MFVSYRFYNIIGFGGRALPAPVASEHMDHLSSDLSFTLEGVAPLVAGVVLLMFASLAVILTPLKRTLASGFLALLTAASGVVLCWIAVSSTIRPISAVVLCVTPLLVGLSLVMRWFWLLRQRER